MPEYVLDHHNQGERERLALMSKLLDPLHRRLIDELSVGSGARTLEVGCGDGSASAWLAAREIAFTAVRGAHRRADALGDGRV